MEQNSAENQDGAGKKQRDRLPLNGVGEIREAIEGCAGKRRPTRWDCLQVGG